MHFFGLEYLSYVTSTLLTFSMLRLNLIHSFETSGHPSTIHQQSAPKKETYVSRYKKIPPCGCLNLQFHWLHYVDVYSVRTHVIPLRNLRLLWNMNMFNM